MCKCFILSFISLSCSLDDVLFTCLTSGFHLRQEERKVFGLLRLFNVQYNLSVPFS